MDDGDGMQMYKERILGELATLREKIRQEGNTTRCKPILFFSTKLLAYDSLGDTMTQRELDAAAICRFG